MYGKQEYAHINALLNRKLAEKKHMIAVHRGSYTGNITQNTVPAYIAAIRMGADMVEGDINSTTDNVLYVFHDGHEPDVFGIEKNVKTMTSEELEALRPYNAVYGRVGRRVNRFEEVLSFLPEHVMYNVDRAWDIFPKVVKVLDKYPNAIHQVLLKAPMRAKEAVEFLAHLLQPGGCGSGPVLRGAQSGRLRIDRRHAGGRAFLGRSHCLHPQQGSVLLGEFHRTGPDAR